MMPTTQRLLGSFISGGKTGLVLMAMVLSLAITQASAHEIRPSIIDLNLSQNGEFDLVLNVNLEALIAGIGDEHDDTESAPQAEHYNSLRALESEELNAELQAFLPELNRDIRLSADDQPLDITFEQAEIPPAGDLDLARDSVITFSGALATDTETLSWTWPERWGANALRVTSPDGEDVYSAYLQDGNSAEGIDISGVVGQSFFGSSVGVIIGLIVVVVLGILSLVVWFRRRVKSSD